MDTSYLAQQVTTIIGQLHGLFDDIGVPSHERDSREAELFSALSETLHSQLRLVTNEKHEKTEEAERLIATIRAMEKALGNARTSIAEGLKVTYPLARCLQELQQKHDALSKIHRQRFEQVRKLAEALESYASHLEPSFVKVKLPPTDPDVPVSPTFDISPPYVTSLDNEFTRVYEEYTRRVNAVKAMCQEIIQLWAELGTPQAQTDSAIVKYHRDAPEQLGLHQEDMDQLKARKERLVEEKRTRERRLAQLRTTIEDLWDRLGIDEQERKSFLNSNRGCALRTINEYEDELARLNELKRQNLHLFVEEARIKLQELWDALYFSEEEMLDFTPAFSDVCSDALLSAHEQEIARLEALKIQRLPILQKIDRHRELVKERDELQASSQDASRLLGRGVKGERRDPGKLLREEKMRKRIAKELPKVEAELKKTLEQWEDEYGRPFLVLGERYLDELYASAAKAPPPRAKTPAASAQPARQGSVRSAPRPRSNTSHGSSIHETFSGPPPSRSKTPTTANFGASLSRNTFGGSVRGTSSVAKSPTKIPSRAPLKNIPHGGNSPTRASHLERSSSTIRKMAPPRAPPPKMQDLFIPPEAAATPANNYQILRDRSESIVRHVPPEDVYDDDDRSYFSRTLTAGSSRFPPPAGISRQTSQISQVSNTSSSATGRTAVSGSENWETFSEQSEDAERDVDFSSFRQPMAPPPHKRYTPDGGQSPQKIQGKKIRSVRGVDGSFISGSDGASIVRIVEGSEAGWTDEDAY